MKKEWKKKNLPASFVVFDILSLKGESLMIRPLSARKEILREVVTSGEQVVLADSFAEKGTAYFQAALKMGMEGVMAYSSEVEVRRGPSFSTAHSSRALRG